MKKQIPNFPDYYATKNGRIWSTKGRGRWLKLQSNYLGYMLIGLQRNKKRCNQTVHRLILETFIGPCPKGKECCHNDSNRSNNHLANLRWDTRSENQVDAVRHGTHVDNRGEKNGLAKLNEVQVRIIRHLLGYGTWTQKEIGKVFGVAQIAISCIKTGKTWSHLK